MSVKPNGVLNTIFSISYAIVIYILATLQLAYRMKTIFIGFTVTFGFLCGIGWAYLELSCHCPN